MNCSYFLSCRIILAGTVLLLSAFSDKNKAPVPYKFPELISFPRMPVAESNPVTIEGAELGRYLFYDTILSGNLSFSCASCHKQENAFSDSPNRFSKGINGEDMVRNTMPLFNLAWYPFYFWDGRASTLEEQVFQPVRAHNEMNLKWKIAGERISKSKFYREKFETVFGTKKIDSVLIAKAIAQFERTLLSYRSKYDLMLMGKAKFTEDELQGYVLVNDMTKGDCLHCHTTDANALGTTLKFSNNGLDKISSAENYKDKGRGEITGKLSDNGMFKIPSLRNVTLTAPYMHDGRFNTLEEVMLFYTEGVNLSANIDTKMGGAHKGGVKLSCEEQQKIISFLKTLTDSSFVNDPAFSNPFRKNK